MLSSIEKYFSTSEKPSAYSKFFSKSFKILTNFLSSSWFSLRSRIRIFLLFSNRFFVPKNDFKVKLLFFASTNLSQLSLIKDSMIFSHPLSERELKFKYNSISPSGTSETDPLNSLSHLRVSLRSPCLLIILAKKYPQLSASLL